MYPNMGRGTPEKPQIRFTQPAGEAIYPLKTRTYEGLRDGMKHAFASNMTCMFKNSGLLVALLLLGMGGVHLRGWSEDAPTCSTVVVADEASQGNTVRVEYIVEWTGNPDKYLIWPLDMENPEWGISRLVTSGTMFENGRTRVVQTVEYTAKASGRHETPPVMIKWADADFPASGLVEKIPPRTIEAKPVGIDFQSQGKAPHAVYIAAGALLACLAAGAGLVLRKRSRATADQSDPGAWLDAQYHQARRLSLDGDFYNAYLTLKTMADHLAKSGKEEAATLARRLDERARAVGFQAVRPPDDEVEMFFKEAKRLAAECGGRNQ